MASATRATEPERTPSPQQNIDPDGVKAYFFPFGSS
jgi:hypothetical protein